MQVNADTSIKKYFRLPTSRRSDTIKSPVFKAQTELKGFLRHPTAEKGNLYQIVRSQWDGSERKFWRK